MVCAVDEYGSWLLDELVLAPELKARLAIWFPGGGKAPYNILVGLILRSFDVCRTLRKGGICSLDIRNY